MRTTRAGVVVLAVALAAGAPAGAPADVTLYGVAGTDPASAPREEAVADALRAVPLGRMGQPEDIAGTVAWLLSPDARGVTGQAIDQNGGAWTG